MPSALPYNSTCCDSCDDLVVTNVPGSGGAPGAPGADGADGINAFTLLAASFTQPAVDGNVTTSWVNNEWVAIGQDIFITAGGYYLVISKPTASQVVIQNRGTSVNAAVGATVGSGGRISPAGLSGLSTGLSGAAGGQLKGTYPEPMIGIANSKGDLIVGNGTDAAALGVGVNGQRPMADDTQALGIKWARIDLSNSGEVANALAITNGGTGQITAGAAFDALSPANVLGDLIYRNNVTNARLARGASGTVVQSNGLSPVYSFIGVNNLNAELGRAPIHFVIAKHLVPSGGNGGASVSGAYRTRTLNTLNVNTLGGSVSLVANQLEIPAGTWRVTAWSTLYASDQHRCGLYNVTDGDWLLDTQTGDEIIGTIADADAGITLQATAAVTGRFTISSAKFIELRYACQTSKATDGQGSPVGFGVNEVFAMLRLECEALTDGTPPIPSSDALVSEAGEGLLDESGQPIVPE